MAQRDWSLTRYDDSAASPKQSDFVAKDSLVMNALLGSFDNHHHHSNCSEREKKRGRKCHAIPCYAMFCVIQSFAESYLPRLERGELLKLELYKRDNPHSIFTVDYRYNDDVGIRK